MSYHQHTEGITVLFVDPSDGLWALSSIKEEGRCVAYSSEGQWLKEPPSSAWHCEPNRPFKCIDRKCWIFDFISSSLRFGIEGFGDKWKKNHWGFFKHLFQNSTPAHSLREADTLLSSLFLSFFQLQKLFFCFFLSEKIIVTFTLNAKKKKKLYLVITSAIEFFCWQI